MQTNPLLTALWIGALAAAAHGHHAHLDGTLGQLTAVALRLWPARARA